MKIDFIKKCVPYADGFSIQYAEDKPKQLIYRSKNNECSLYFGSFPDSPLEPLLLTRTIEGMNRESKSISIFIADDEIRIFFEYPKPMRAFNYTVGNYTIDEAKTAALEYVFKNGGK